MPWSMARCCAAILLARGNFDSLPIPFRAVAADLADRTAVVLATGDLARAVRASFAIPLVFAPESLNGRILADGGLAANIPVAVARAAGSRTSHRLRRHRASQAIRSTCSPQSGWRIGCWVFCSNRRADSLGPEDVLVRPAVEGFPSLNFSAGQRGPADPIRQLERPTPPSPGRAVFPRRPAPRGRCCHAGSLAWRSRETTPLRASRFAASWVSD